MMNENRGFPETVGRDTIFDPKFPLETESEPKVSSRLDEAKVHLRTGFEFGSVVTEANLHWRGPELVVGTVMVVVATVEVSGTVTVRDSEAMIGSSRVTVGGSEGLTC